MVLERGAWLIGQPSLQSEVKDGILEARPGGLDSTFKAGHLYLQVKNIGHPGLQSGRPSPVFLVWSGWRIQSSSAFFAQFLQCLSVDGWWEDGFRQAFLGGLYPFLMIVGSVYMFFNNINMLGVIVMIILSIMVFMIIMVFIMIMFVMGVLITLD